MLSIALAGVWARKRRLVGTATAVVLGVAFLAATLVLGDTMRAGFARAFTEANAGTDVIVRSSSAMGGETRVRDVIDEGLVERVAVLDGVSAAVPTIEGIGTILAADGQRIGGGGPPTVATNWIAEPGHPDLNPYRLAEGRAPSPSAAKDEPYEIVIDRRSADGGGLAVGDRTRVLTPAPVDVVVVGVATFGDMDSLGPTTFTAFALDDARQLLAPRPDTISSVLVAAEGRVSTETLRDEIAALLPARIEALTQGELTAEQQADIEQDFLGMFQMILLAFAAIALVVATFTIHNTFSVLTAQRQRESALLRAVGASRRQVVLAVAVEALAVGVLASAVGIGAGLGIASGLDALLAGAGFDVSTSGLAIGGGSIATAATVGVLATLAACVTPAVTASRVRPLAALRDVAVDRSASSGLRAVAGAFITATGGAVILTSTIDGDGALSRAGLGALAVLVGAVVLGPVVARPAASILGAGTRIRGVSGRLARRNAMRNPRRVAGSASALMVGTGVVALFTTFGSSIKASIDGAVDTTFTGDLVVIQDDFSGAGMSVDMAPAIGELATVDAAVGVSFASASIDGAGVEPAATDPALLAAAFDLDVRQGSLEQLAPGQLAVSARYADEQDLAIGDTVPMTFVDGATAPLRVGAIYKERMSFGDLIITRQDWAPHARQSGDTVVFVNLVDGTTDRAGQAAVDDVTGRFDAPGAQTRDEYVDGVGAQIDQMLAFVYGLLAVAILIALIGIGNTLTLSIHERTRELGLLRAVGQTRAQLRSTVRWESVIVAVFGTVGGLGIGTFLGWGTVRAMRAEEGFGVFAAPWSSLAVVLVLAAGAGVVAAVRPARRAARMDILSAIATD